MGVCVCVCVGCAGVRQGVCVSNLISVILHCNYLNVKNLFVKASANCAYSLWASNRNPAPPGGFLETTIFGNLSHRAIEIRLKP